MAKRKFPKTHTFKITVTMDKGCRVATALREVRDCIHGEFYCTALEDKDPEAFKVRTIARLSQR